MNSKEQVDQFYKEFLKVCDFNAPQVYWNAGKAGQELAESYEQYLEIKELPFIPAGRAYYGGGFPKPTPDEVAHFLNMAQSIGCPAAFFWSADALFDKRKPLPEIRQAIADYEWIGPGEPEPPIEPPDDKVIVEQVEIRVSGILYENQTAAEMRLIIKEE